MGNDDYREQFRANLRAAMAYHAESAQSLKASYLAGPKKTKKVAIRTVSNLCREGDLDAVSSPSLDVIAALAAKLGMPAYQLLVPGFDPEDLRPGGVEHWIEREVERRLALRWKRARGTKDTIEGEHEKGSRARSPFPRVPLPGGGEAKASSKAKAAKRPSKIGSK